MAYIARSARFTSALTLAGLLLAGLFVVLNTACPAAHADPGVRYVALDGADDGACDSVAGRCRTVQYAVDVAAPYDEVWVAQGMYTTTGAAVVAIGKSLTLYGGWNGTDADVRDPHAYPTTLDAQGASQGVLVGEGITVTVEGLTVTNGVAPGYGAGLYARDADLTLREVTFYRNAISTTLIDSPLGGGAMVEGGTLLADGCTFRENSVWAPGGPQGGGLAISGTLQATVEDSLFEGNDAWFASGLHFAGNAYPRPPLAIRRSEFRDNGRGLSPGPAYGGYAGAVAIVQADARIEDSTFAGSRSDLGWGAVRVASSKLAMERCQVYGSSTHYDTSGISLSGVSPFTLTNNLIVDNRSTYDWELHQAVHIYGGTGMIAHNTIARNGNTYGIKVEHEGDIGLGNTILVSHTVGITVATGSRAKLLGVLFGEETWASGEDWAGGGDIGVGLTSSYWGDPAFVDYASGDYHITAASDAIDRGVATSVTDDFDGEHRPYDGDHDGLAEPDIGADEWVEFFDLYLPLVLRSD
jgi:hypothetical protein